MKLKSLVALVLLASLAVWTPTTEASGASPLVFITSPANGTNVTGGVNIVYAINDGENDSMTYAIEVFGAQYGLLDSGNTSGLNTSIFWNTTGWPNGTYSIVINANDGTSNGTATRMNLFVNNTTPPDQPPLALFSSPGNGSNVSGIFQLTYGGLDVDTPSLFYDLSMAPSGQGFTTLVNTTQLTANYSYQIDTRTYLNGDFDFFLQVDDGSNISQANLTLTFANLGDDDGDGLLDQDENITYGTNWTDGDTDGDGHYDGNEIINGTDPLNASDPPAPNLPPSISFTSPTDQDTVNGTIFINYSATDGDGDLLNLTIMAYPGPAGSNSSQLFSAQILPSSGIYPWNTTTWDNGTVNLTLFVDDGTDNDMDVISVTVQHHAIAQPEDTDGDGLLDIDENNTHLTLWNNSDSDGDGLGDGQEITNGTDPLDFDDPNTPPQITFITNIEGIEISGPTMIQFRVQDPNTGSLTWEFSGNHSTRFETFQNGNLTGPIDQILTLDFDPAGQPLGSWHLILIMNDAQSEDQDWRNVTITEVDLPDDPPPTNDDNDNATAEPVIPTRVVLGGGIAAASLLVGLLVIMRTDGGRRMVWFGLLPLYSKLKREKLMEHDSRVQVLDSIKEEPGIYFSELCRRTGLSNGVVAYHIQVLEREQYLNSQRINGKRCYFTPETMPKQLEQPDNEGVALRIQELITARPGIKLAEAAKQLGLSKPLVLYHLNKMTGQAHRKREGRQVALYPGATTEGTMAEQIIAHLKQRPGITQAELAKLLGISSSGLRYQLDKLEKEGIIEKIKIGRSPELYHRG